MSSTATDFVPVPETRSNGRRFLLWFGVLGGLISWAVHLVVSWALVPWSCDQDNVIWIHATTVVAAVIALLAIFSGLVVWRRTKKEDAPERARIAWTTDRFMSVLGMLTSGIFLVLILAEGAGAFVLQPCVVS